VMHLTLLVTLILVSHARVGRTRMCDTRYCQCAKDVGTFVAAKCKIEKFEDLRNCIQTPSRVSTLDISSNHLCDIPTSAFAGFDNLVNLSLANNNIEVIGNKSLQGLTRLQYLNLKDNKLIKWRGNLTAQTPKLKVIDVTGNGLWLPGNNILGLQSLQIVIGANWSKTCTQCTLVRNDSHHGNEIQSFKDGEFFHGREGECRAMKYVVSDQLHRFASHGFYSNCFEENTTCYSTLVESIPIHRCWDMDNYILNIEFLLGPIAVVLNSLVLFITLLTPKLRKNVAMILVCNIAISDLCLSVYAILITSVRKMPYVKFYVVMDYVCPCLGFLWLMAQCVTVMTLVFLTIERYLAIVYCMSPAVRMRQKLALKCAASSWVVAIAIAILPVSGIGVYTSNTYCIPMNRRKDIPHMYGFSIGIALTAILLYLVTLPLYVRIYRFVRQSGMEGFSRADSSVAKKIAVMVGCNMFFFCLPIFIGFLWVSFHVTKGLDPIVKEIITGVIPTIAFTFNSLINPLLYAYRNKSFVNALGERFELLRTKARAWSLSNSPPTPQRTCTEEVNMINNVR
ncbi:hypothetical protein QZH41_009264, partial [Actinostola sp. cb2023]